LIAVYPDAEPDIMSGKGAAYGGAMAIQHHEHG
jgi:hypothetical protein